jgi:phosphomannomutase
MSLIVSISGIRGTIGGAPEKNLTPLDIVQFAAAYGAWLRTRQVSNKIVLGRDARPSGEMLHHLVSATLRGQGFDIIDLGLSTTPTVEVAVPDFEAAGGIILTASHNPVEWNALKLLNHKGEFITKKDGLELLEIAQKGSFRFAEVRNLGKSIPVKNYTLKHIEKILALSLIDVFAIQKENFRVVVDGVNSSGGVAVPQLLLALGIKKEYFQSTLPTDRVVCT